MPNARCDVESLIIDLTTGRAVVDITERVAGFVGDKGDGLVSVFAPHATAGIAIIETGTGSDHDLLDRIDAIFPRDDGLYRHRHGSIGHGADHVIPGFVSPSVTVPVIDGRMTLGTWQSVVLVDPNADNSQRRVRLSFIAG